MPFRLEEDIPQLFSSLWDDTVAIGTWPNVIVLGAAAGGALALREDADGEVLASTAGHPLRWGDGSRVLRQFGEFTYQIPVIAGVYGWSLWTQDEQLHEFSKSLISAYTISSLTTVALKGITDTQRPTVGRSGSRLVLEIRQRFDRRPPHRRHRNRQLRPAQVASRIQGPYRRSDEHL